MGYSFLEPVRVGPHTLRNRITKSAMAEYICAGDGTVSDRYVEFYRTIAAGGASLVVPGIIPLVEPQDPPIFMGTFNPSLATDEAIGQLARVVDAVHGEGALIMFQIWHSGCYATPDGLKSMVDDFTTEELRALEGRFVDAARRAKAAGADGVEFHMAHTYLASQLLSPFFNHRTDEYGSDTIENATRFAKNVIERIDRELCDNTFTVIVKLQGSDCTTGGITADRAAEAAAILEKAGATMFTVNAGGALVGYQYMSDNGHRPEGWKVDFAAAVKERVSVPVATCGNIRHPDYMHELIRDGKADIIALGRELYADPEFPVKCATGREDELRYCVSCLYCFTPVPEDDSIPGCTVNPWCRSERAHPELVHDGDGRRVAIVGAGVSGLEAAVVLAGRGFAPTVFERSTHLGGLVDLAAKPPHKERLAWIIDYYERQLRRLGVEVRLGVEATPEVVSQINPYAVFVATGTNEVVPGRIPGIHGPNVVRVRDVLNRKVRFCDKRLAIIGGGMTGIETAHMLALGGNEVHVIEMLPEKPLGIADKLSFGDAFTDGVQIHYEHQLVLIDEGGIDVRDLASDTDVRMDCDAVILSMGIRADPAVIEAFEAAFERVVPVGDAAALGRIPTNIRSGADAAYALA
ncbi:oxidoreductase [Collinsella ihumii]|uniref:oxidoreductase n=1 Tax=Collinsella ihumii TaxID=1720204 RepID=UPI00082CD5AA|nr:FAD-dependent oxidoreductase [Collinsella ihumii]